MARSTVAQVVQIGVETAPGTLTPADKTLGSLSIALSPSVESQAFRPKGNKYATVVAANKEWAEGKLEGQPTYDEIVYPLSGVLTQAIVTPVAAAVGAYSWEFSPASASADNPATFTLEQGDATLAERATHLLFTDLDVEFSRSEVKISGTALAKALERAIVLTPGAEPVATSLVPILPGQVCLYASAVQADLGLEASHIDTGLSVKPSIGGRYNPVWFLNCQEDSFTTFVETPEPDYGVELTLEADGTGVAWADLFRTGATRFLRIEAKGPEIVPGTPASAYRLTWDLAVKVLEPGEYSDEDGLYAIAPKLQVVHDATWGRASRITVVNTLAAL